MTLPPPPCIESCSDDGQCICESFGLMEGGRSLES